MDARSKFTSKSAYDRPMARWLAPRSRVGTLVVQILVLAIGLAIVYLVVTWLGSDLNTP